MEKVKVLKQTSFTAIAIPVGEGGGAVEIDVHPDVTKDTRRPNNDEGRSGGGWKLPPWAKVGLVVVVMGLVAAVAALTTSGSTVPAAEVSEVTCPAINIAASTTAAGASCAGGVASGSPACDFTCASGYKHDGGGSITCGSDGESQEGGMSRALLAPK